MSLSTYSHVFSTWEVYPRVYYFMKRFKDVHKRFLNIINKGQYSVLFKKSGVFDELEKLKCQLETPLTIRVIGRNNLDRDKLVVTTEPLQRAKKAVDVYPLKEESKQTSEEEGITVFVAYASISNIGSYGLKEIEETVGHFLSSYGKASLVPVHNVVIACHTTEEYTESEIHNFRSSVIGKLTESFGLDITADKIVIGTGDETLCTKISQMLETEIIVGFYRMKGYLQGFMCSKGRLDMEKADVLGNEKVIAALQGFLRNGLGLVDILEDSKSENLPFVDIVIRHLARIIRCAIVEPLSVKVNLPQNLCNQMAIELKFEEHVITSVPKNTQYHLSKLKQPSEDLMKAMKEHDSSYRFPGGNFTFIAYSLRDDVRKVVLELEEALLSLKRTTTMMKKMIFEIDGNIKQSVIEAADVKNRKKKLVVSKELRKRILLIDGVYAAGTVCDEFEIHVKTDEAKNMVRDFLNQLKMESDVRVRKVNEYPKQLAGRHVEHGIVIQSPYPGDEKRFRSGTLGLFVDGNNDGLYALTCAHVVNNVRDVYIKNGKGERELFATCDPGMTVLVGGEEHPLVDIAAVKVDPNFCPYCTKFLKDDDGILKCAELSAEMTHELSGRYIYKYGATSHLTRGVVCSVDYTLTDGPDDYLVLILCPAGSEDNEEYARPGDSGSVNCMPNVDSNKTVKAVSMLNLGDLKLEGEDDQIFISFQLNTGLQTLNDRHSGVHLHVPNIYDDQSDQQNLMF